MARGGAYNPVTRLMSVLDAATAQGHFAYNPLTGAIVAKYTLAITGDYFDCGWDPTGRYLYVVYGNVFSVYDFGADQSQALLTPTLVASKQFVVHSLSLIHI